MATKILGGMRKHRSSINIKNLSFTPHNYCCKQQPPSKPPAPPGAPQALSGAGAGGGGSKGAIEGDMDLVQKLFLEKIREYRSLSKDNKMVDPSKKILDELNHQLIALATKFNLNIKEDLTKFPNFVWKDPDIDPINQKEILEREQQKNKQSKDKKSEGKDDQKK